MANDWHHIATTPDGFTVHRLDAEAIARDAQAFSKATGADLARARAQIRGEYCEALRTALGFPEGWMAHSEWSSSLVDGAPDRPPLSSVEVQLWPERS